MTKKERNAIYKIALRDIKSKHKYFIYSSIEDIKPFTECNVINFPELFLFRDNYIINAWLSEQHKEDEYLSGTKKGIMIREIVLLFCIEMTIK